MRSARLTLSLVRISSSNVPLAGVLGSNCDPSGVGIGGMLVVVEVLVAAVVVELVVVVVVVFVSAGLFV